MPKRSNAFQRLILVIYRQLQPPGGSVEESALLTERNGSTKREVDLLLKHRAFDMELRIAVECRGRRHKDDIQWIDGLIGKYRDLDVDKVVAVSKSGFSKGAAEKALSAGIETLTLQKALDTNWTDQFKRLGVAQLTRRDVPVGISISTSPAPTLQLTTTTRVFSDAGTLLGTVEEMGQAIYRHRQEDINRTIKEKALQLFLTLEDLKTKHLLIEMTQQPKTACYILADDGITQMHILSVTVQIRCIFAVEVAAVSHYVLGSAQISTAAIGSAEQPVTMVAVQSIDRPNQVSVAFAQEETKIRSEGPGGLK